MKTFVISCSHGKFCTNQVDLGALKALLAMEAEIDCWWYDICGVRFEETFVFIEAPQAIYSESDAP